MVLESFFNSIPKSSHACVLIHNCEPCGDSATRAEVVVVDDGMESDDSTAMLDTTGVEDAVKSIPFPCQQHETVSSLLDGVCSRLGLDYARQTYEAAARNLTETIKQQDASVLLLGMISFMESLPDADMMYVVALLCTVLPASSHACRKHDSNEKVNRYANNAARIAPPRLRTGRSLPWYLNEAGDGIERDLVVEIFDTSPRIPRRLPPATTPCPSLCVCRLWDSVRNMMPSDKSANKYSQKPEQAVDLLGQDDISISPAGGVEKRRPSLGRTGSSGKFGDQDLFVDPQEFTLPRLWSEDMILNGTKSFPIFGNIPFDDYYWATQFSNHSAVQSLDPEEKAEQYIRLSVLAQDFDRTATMYAKIIASERHLAVRQRTIRPVKLGGIAGGEKYICAAIVFKFAVDSTGLYGNDDLAAKAARHDMKGLNALFECQEGSVRLPPMTVIDYKGVTIVAMARVPIRKHTILYGSSDGGRTVHNSDARINDVMSHMGQRLNLRPHRTGDKEMHICGDLEVHAGLDGHYYIIDFARVAPPEPPPTKKDSANAYLLHRLFRLEFVRSNPEPLCSDGYSLWDDDENRGKHCDDIRDAYDRLIGEIIPDFARHLDMLRKKGLVSENEPFDFSECAHKWGINIRHLGRVRHHVKDAFWKKSILTELTARAIKTSIKSLLRCASIQLSGHPSEEPYRQLVFDILNGIFSYGGCLPNGSLLWAMVAHTLNEKYQVGISDPRMKIMWGFCFCRVQEMLGLEVVESFVSTVMKPERQKMSRRDQFIMDGDLLGLGVLTHRMNAIKLGIGVHEYKQSLVCRREQSHARAINSFNQLSQSNLTSMLKGSSIYSLAGIQCAKQLFYRASEVYKTVQDAEEIESSEYIALVHKGSRVYLTACKAFEDEWGSVEDVDPEKLVRDELDVWVTWARELLAFAVAKSKGSVHRILYGDDCLDHRILREAKRILIMCRKGYARLDGYEEAVRLVKQEWQASISQLPLMRLSPNWTLAPCPHADSPPTCATMIRSTAENKDFCSQFVVGHSNGRIYVYDLSTCEIECALGNIVDKVTVIAEQNSVLYCCTETGYIYSFHYFLDGETSHRTCIKIVDAPIRTFAPAGQYFFCSCDCGTIRVLEESRDGTLVKHADLDEHLGGRIESLIYGEKVGAVFSGCINGTICMWSSVDCSLLKKFHQSFPVRAMTVCDGHCCLFSSSKNVINRWNLSSGRSDVAMEHGRVDIDTLVAVAGVLYSGSNQSGTISAWSLKDFHLLYELNGRDPVSRVLCADSATLIASGPGQNLFAWNLQSLLAYDLIYLGPYGNRACDTALDSAVYQSKHWNGKFYMNMPEGEVVAVDAETFEITGRCHGHEKTPAVVLGVDGCIVTYDCSGLMYKWTPDLQSVVLKTSISSFRNTLSAVVHEDGLEFYIGGDHGRVYIISSQTLEVVGTLQSPSSTLDCRCLTVSTARDPPLLWAGFVDNLFVEFNLKSRTVVREIRMDARPNSIAISRASQRAANAQLFPEQRIFLGRDDGVFEFIRADGTFTPFQNVSSEPIHDLVVSGMYLFTSGDDRCLRMWSIPSGRCLTTVPAMGVGVTMAAHLGTHLLTEGVFNRSYGTQVFEENPSRGYKVLAYAWYNRYWDGRGDDASMRAPFPYKYRRSDRFLNMNTYQELAMSSVRLRSDPRQKMLDSYDAILEGKYNRDLLFPVTCPGGSCLCYVNIEYRSMTDQVAFVSAKDTDLFSEGELVAIVHSNDIHRYVIGYHIHDIMESMLSRVGTKEKVVAPIGLEFVEEATDMEGGKRTMAPTVSYANDAHNPNIKFLYIGFNSQESYLLWCKFLYHLVNRLRRPTTNADQPRPETA